jgi:beta-N-acetylhexosaminidase
LCAAANDYSDLSLQKSGQNNLFVFKSLFWENFSVKKHLALLLLLLLVIQTFAPILSVHAAGNVPASDPEQKARVLLAQMTPQEKVGQLFLVSFKGTDVSEQSQIYDLVKNHFIGGVVLDQASDNFTGEDTLVNAQNLITGLQSVALSEDTFKSNSTDIQTSKRQIPLFIGVSQEGDESPNDQILAGMTPLANEMAIGATWNTANAEATGQVLGRELHDIGFNMLFGPSLDVLDSVRTVDSEDLGVRTFGGDPFWVGEMGKAYIQGVHEGSMDQIAVIAKNFPGRGSADRPAEDEVATVRKSLEQLKQIELAPFFAVTNPSNEVSEQTDGLLVSHIRYQGFQGNIRATTKPVSLDSNALEQILSLDPISSWRQSGGVIVSDDLGTASIEKFFDPTGKTFDARQVAKTAFLAGNDLLYLGNIVSSGDENSYSSTIKILDLFVQKYQEDSSFAQKVDDSVLRILTLKYKLYSSFTMNLVLPDANALAQVGLSTQVTAQVASQAVTLISPDLADLDSVLPNPPQGNERIVFISDTVTAKQCSTCGSMLEFSADDFRNAVVKLYGQSGSAEIQDYHLTSMTFDDLESFLDQTGDVITLQDELASADWIVLSIVSDAQSGVSKELMRRFLSEKAELLRNKKVIGFAFNAPYYLDATDISKLTAYYGVYGKTTPFVNAAARALFQELVPSGNLPVSVQGVGYDIITATTPDPDQVIQLMVDENSSATATPGTPQLTPTAQTVYNVGDTLPIRTGIILDHNGHPVPDGTIVRFMIDTGSSSGSVETVETTTVNGVAKTSYRIPSKGLLGITVQAEPALVSQTLQLDITDKGGVLTAIEPTFLPTNTTGETSDASTTPPPAVLTAPNYHSEGLPTPGDWFLSTILILGLAAGLYWLGSNRASTQWGIRWGVLSVAGGYLAYAYLVIGLPGSAYLISQSGSLIIALLSLGGSLLGWVAALVWWRVETNKNRKEHTG